MPYYTTERGVTTYSDRDTPLEYASGADEERAAYNEAHDAAVAAAEKLLGLFDGLCEPPLNVHRARLALDRIGGQIVTLVAQAEALSGET